jgi:hypothetical protein
VLSNFIVEVQIRGINKPTVYAKFSFQAIPILQLLSDVYKNQYDRWCRGCALMLSLYKLTGTDGQAQVSIGMHVHPKILFLH